MSNEAAAADRPVRTTWIDRAERYGLIVAWVVVIAGFGVARPDTFLSWANFSTILGSQAVLVVVRAN